MNVIVTGASSGVGYELTKKLIADGRITKVIGIARRGERLNELADYANSVNRNEVFVSLPEDVSTVSLESITCQVNRVDALVNNAGLLINKPFSELDEQDFLAVYQVNVFAPARLIRLLKPLMGVQSVSHIVNIGSMGGFQGASKFAGLSAYSSSKSAIAGLSECLAEEFKDDNIKVNCLAFGAVQTEMLQKAFPEFQAPLTSVQMADFVLDFTLNGHKYFNGKILPVSCSTP
ncbi:MAG: SDR family oxidoreductase [Flavobacteriales bacterium]|nr:SDR family oxidoreductase [Flavobacteriales bacterium]